MAYLFYPVQVVVLASGFPEDKVDKTMMQNMFELLVNIEKGLADFVFNMMLAISKSMEAEEKIDVKRLLSFFGVTLDGFREAISHRQLPELNLDLQTDEVRREWATWKEVLNHMRDMQSGAIRLGEEGKYKEDASSEL